MAERIVVAMSGGVDSSVAAALLHERGVELVGAFMRTGVPDPDTLGPGRTKRCCSVEDAGDAAAVAGALGIPFYALDHAADFARIIDYFAGEYHAGRTPNPCVVCNQDLKFGSLLRFADQIGATAVATGHYARIGEHAGRQVLLPGVDALKDQSYYLWGQSQVQLARTRFPLGALTKDAVREHARRFGLRTHDKPESMEICFVPGNDYRAVLRERTPDRLRPGQFVDPHGEVLGTHDGYQNFTIGQRRGLGLALGHPTYVVAIDAATNTVTLGTAGDLLARTFRVRQVNWVSIAPPAAGTRLAALVRIRHGQVPQPATLVVNTPGDDDRARAGDGVVTVSFRTPVQAITPGQAMIAYAAGGAIAEARPLDAGPPPGAVLCGGWIHAVQATEEKEREAGQAIKEKERETGQAHG